MSDIIKELTSVLGTENVLTGADVSKRPSGIWDTHGIEARSILRPRSTAEVSAVMKICYARDQAVVAQSGRTGLTQAHLSSKDDVVLSLERMNKIEEIDPVGRTMTVQAGVLLQTIQETAEQAGLNFPVDLGARGSCMIGGNVSTNAGGNRVLRYGMVRDNILGLEAVLADGSIITSMNKMIKNNAGYDLKQLFIGSEGTLGIVTRLVLRLREAPGSQDTAIVAINEFSRVTDFLKFIDKELGGTLSAFEVMWQDYYKLVTTTPARSSPPIEQGYSYYVLVESQGANQEIDSPRFEKVLAQALDQGILADVVVAKSQEQRNAMWAIREDVEQARQYRPVIAFDVSLELKYMENYVEEVTQSLEKNWPGNRCFIFGHLADGNLHLIVSAGDGSEQSRQEIEDCIYQPLQEISGSVSAEHGIGLDKKPYLTLSRSDIEIALMRRLKQALDPKGILNPGKIFD